MSIRHHVIAAVLAALAPLAFAQAPAEPGQSDPDVFFKGRMGGTFGKNIVEVMPAARRVAVPAFRVAFVTDNSITAQVRASYLPGIDRSGASSSFFVALKGVDARTMQAITDKAYADLLAQITASGREVVPMDQMKDFFGAITPTAPGAGRAYSKTANGQTVSVFTPTGMPLMFTHFEGAMGDRSPFDLNNYRRLEEYSFHWKAAVIAPLLVINFAKMSSSGNQSGLVARTAETGAELSMSVASMNSFYSRTDEFRNGMGMGGDQGSFSLAVPIASPLQFGTMVTVAQDDNSAVKSIFDVLGRAGGLANAGGAARSSKKMVAETSDQSYAAAATDALQRMNVTLASWFRKYPPAN